MKINPIAWPIYHQIMRLLRLRGRRSPHADRPEWLQAEMQDKAARLRTDRAYKRLQAVRTGGMMPYTVETTIKRKGRKEKKA